MCESEGLLSLLGSCDAHAGERACASSRSSESKRGGGTVIIQVAWGKWHGGFVHKASETGRAQAVPGGLGGVLQDGQTEQLHGRFPSQGGQYVQRPCGVSRHAPCGRAHAFQGVRAGWWAGEGRMGCRVVVLSPGCMFKSQQLAVSSPLPSFVKRGVPACKRGGAPHRREGLPQRGVQGVEGAAGPWELMRPQRPILD